MIEKDFDYVLKEYFNTSDRRSMKALLSLNEAEQNQAVVSLAAKLYEKIVAKVDDIDYGTIPASTGDITRIGNYKELRECMDTIRQILVHYKQNTSQLDIVDRAIENVKDSKKIWEKAFVMECELPIIFYNTICLSIVSAVSLLISSSIDFIKEPGNQTYQISFDRVGYNKTKDKLLFQNLDKFNKAYVNGDIEKLMSSVIRANKNVKESAVVNVQEGVLAVLSTIAGAGAIAGVLIKIVIPVLHELTNLFFCTKQKVSEYFEIQSKVIQMNAETLKYDYTKSEEQIAKIYKKQSKIADLFKKIANALAVKMNKADSDARKMIKKEKEEKYTVDDLDAQDIPALTSSIF